MDKREPNLGLATTRELLDEIRSRIQVDYFSGGGGLEYTTVAGRPESVLFPPVEEPFSGGGGGVLDGHLESVFFPPGEEPPHYDPPSAESPHTRNGKEEADWMMPIRRFVDSLPLKELDIDEIHTVADKMYLMVTREKVELDKLIKSLFGK